MRIRGLMLSIDSVQTVIDGDSQQKTGFSQQTARIRNTGRDLTTSTQSNILWASTLSSTLSFWLPGHCPAGGGSLTEVRQGVRRPAL
jgi:hypothetical protein